MWGGGRTSLQMDVQDRVCGADTFQHVQLIVYGCLDVSQSVISRSAGLIQGSTAVSPDMP